MISGPQALADIERAIADTRAKEGELDAVLASATAEAQRLRQSQTDAFRALARMRLDALAGEAISGRLEATERRALQLMDAARQALADLAARRTVAAAAVEEHERALAGVRQAVATVDDEIDRLTAATAARGKADPAWIAAKAHFDEATRVAAEAEKKAATAEADRRAKGAPYEADPLFMYLWTRRFGTSDYKAGNLVRYLDRKVAALVGFVEARPNYAVLTEIPLRLREHAERRKAAVTAAETELSALERGFLVADGIETVEARRLAAQAEADRVDAVLKAARGHLATAEQEHALARDGGDKGGFAEAVDLIAGEMAREDLQELYKAAFATPDPRDEKIVRQIESLVEAIAKADREIADIRAEARAIAGRRGQIETVRDDFRRKGYDRPEARFGNEQVIGQILGGIIGGALSSPDLWRVLLDGFSERPRRADPGFGGGRRFPGPGPGGFGGGGGGGGDNRGGGGFTTGGGF